MQDPKEMLPLCHDTNTVQGAIAREAGDPLHMFPMFVFPCSHRSNNTLGTHLVPGTVPCHHTPVHQQQCDIHMTTGLACRGTNKLLQGGGVEEGAHWLCLP